MVFKLSAFTLWTRSDVVDHTIVKQNLSLSCKWTQYDVLSFYNNFIFIISFFHFHLVCGHATVNYCFFLLNNRLGFILSIVGDDVFDPLHSCLCLVVGWPLN